MTEVMPLRVPHAGSRPRKSEVQLMRERTEWEYKKDLTLVAHEEAADVFLEVAKRISAAMMLQRATRAWLARTAPEREARTAARKAEEERLRRLEEEEREKKEAYLRARMSMPNLPNDYDTESGGHHASGKDANGRDVDEDAQAKKKKPIVLRPWAPRRKVMTPVDEMDWNPPSRILSGKQSMQFQGVENVESGQYPVHESAESSRSANGPKAKDMQWVPLTPSPRGPLHGPSGGSGNVRAISESKVRRKISQAAAATAVALRRPSSAHPALASTSTSMRSTVGFVGGMRRSASKESVKSLAGSDAVLPAKVEVTRRRPKSALPMVDGMGLKPRSLGLGGLLTKMNQESQSHRADRARPWSTSPQGWARGPPPSWQEDKDPSTWSPAVTVDGALRRVNSARSARPVRHSYAGPASPMFPSRAPTMESRMSPTGPGHTMPPRPSSSVSKNPNNNDGKDSAPRLSQPRISYAHPRAPMNTPRASAAGSIGDVNAAVDDQEGSRAISPVVYHANIPSHPEMGRRGMLSRRMSTDSIVSLSSLTEDREDDEDVDAV